MRILEIGFILLIFVGIIGIQNSYAQNCFPLELNYEIEGGEITSTCNYYDDNMIVFSIEPVREGEITIEIPRIELDSIINCQDDRFFVLLDKDETDYHEIDTSPIVRTLKINFTSTTSTIKIIGPSIPVANASEQALFCIEQRLKEIPPKKQLKIGVDLDGVVCKEGLEKIFKITNDSVACVYPETAQKLVDREWGKFPRF